MESLSDFYNHQCKVIFCLCILCKNSLFPKYRIEDISSTSMDIIAYNPLESKFTEHFTRSVVAFPDSISPYDEYLPRL